MPDLEQQLRPGRLDEFQHHLLAQSASWAEPQSRVTPFRLPKHPNCASCLIFDYWAHAYACMVDYSLIRCTTPLLMNTFSGHNSELV